MPVTEATNTHYDKHLQDWKTIHRMFTGNRVEQELVEGAFEADHTFKRRKKRADWRPHTRDLVSRLTGELFTKGGEITRETPISSDYLSSVGEENESYKVQLINFAETLTAYQEAWAIMDPARGLMIVEPQQVPRWNSEAVVLKGTRSPQTSVFADQSEVDVWTVYYNNRYEVYAKSDKEGVKEEQVDSGFYVNEEWAFSSGPPAVRITLPWKVRFGLAIARAHRSLYQMESKFDEALTNSLGGLVQIATSGDEDLKMSIEKALKGGSIAVPYDKDSGEHKPLNVGIEGLPHGAKTLERKREELYRVAHQKLEQASKRMSATEATERKRSGAASALAVLAKTMESAETEILNVIAEAEDRRNATRNLEIDVGYPDDYSSSFDSSDEQLARDIFGSLGLPVDTDTATEVVAQRLQGEGISVETQIGPNGRTRREAIREAVEQTFSQQAQQESAASFDLS